MIYKIAWFIGLHEYEKNSMGYPITPQNTNLAGGRVRGYSLVLGRKTFIDELFTRVDYSTRPRYQGPS